MLLLVVEYVIWPGRFVMYSFVLKTQRALEDARRHDEPRQFCLLLLACYNQHVRTTCFAPLCRADRAVLCYVLAADAQRQNMLAQELGVLVFFFEQKKQTDA